MKAIILLAVLAVLAFAARTGAHGTGSIVTSYPSPAGAEIGGIALSGGYLYHAASAVHLVYKTTTTGSRVGGFRMPNYVTVADLTLDATSVWTCNALRCVYKINPATGSVQRSWYAPEPGRGIAYGEGCLWYAAKRRIYRYLANGSLLGSFTVPILALGGLEYADGYLWAVDRTDRRLIQYTTTGSAITIYKNPPGPGVYGVARTSGARPAYYWYTDLGTRWVYQVTAGYTSVAPASFGRIKGMYH